MKLQSGCALMSSPFSFGNATSAYIRAEHVSIIKRRKNNGMLYASTVPVDNNEVEVDTSHPCVTKFSFGSCHREIKEESLYWIFNDGDIFLFDHSHDALEFALDTLKLRATTEVDLRWVRFVQDTYEIKSPFLENAYKESIKEMRILKVVLWASAITIAFLTYCLSS